MRSFILDSLELSLEDWWSLQNWYKVSFYQANWFFLWFLCVAATGQWPYPGFPLPLQLPSCAVILPTHSTLTIYQSPQVCPTPLCLQNLTEVQAVTSSAEPMTEISISVRRTVLISWWAPQQRRGVASCGRSGTCNTQKRDWLRRYAGGRAASDVQQQDSECRTDGRLSIDCWAVYWHCSWNRQRTEQGWILSYPRAKEVFVRRKKNYQGMASSLAFPVTRDDLEPADFLATWIIMHSPERVRSMIEAPCRGQARPVLVLWSSATWTNTRPPCPHWWHPHHSVAKEKHTTQNANKVF